jgi:NifU-like protein involved in Fe-S cluster formation
VSQNYLVSSLIVLVVIRSQLISRLEDDKIADLKFEANGCAISVAAMSLLSDYLLNKNKAEVLALKYQNVLDILGVPVAERRYKCVLLGLLAVQNIILKAENNPERTWDDLM